MGVTQSIFHRGRRTKHNITTSQLSYIPIYFWFSVYSSEHINQLNSKISFLFYKHAILCIIWPDVKKKNGISAHKPFEYGIHNNKYRNKYTDVDSIKYFL